jgi:hypothetical protein
MSNLYIIATSHDDRVRGPEKLLRIYERIKPDILLSESDKESLNILREWYLGIESRLMKLTEDEQAVKMFIGFFRDYGLGFETNTNVEYAKRHGINHYFSDKHEHSERMFNLGKMIMDNLLCSAEKKGYFDTKHIYELLKKDSNPSQNKIKKHWIRLKRGEGIFLGEIPLL